MIAATIGMFWLAAATSLNVPYGRCTLPIVRPQSAHSSWVQVRCVDCGAVTARHPFPSLLGQAVNMEPFEQQLSAGTTTLLRTMRYRIRLIARFVGWSLNRWARWFTRALVFSVLALLAPLFDMALVTAWKEAGWRGVGRWLLRGLVVYVGLLLDRHAPLIGKVVILLAVAYGVASRDLLPDASFPVGVLDDVLAVVLASRGFLLLCPEHLVEAHAIRAAGTDGRRAWRRARLLPPVG